MITKAERAELRSIVRQQFKVLRAEVEQRRAEMQVEFEQQITERFASADHDWSDLMHVVQEAVLEANRKINDALYAKGYEVKGSSEQMWVSPPRLQQPSADKMQLRRVADARIHAQVKAALLKLDRDEADLLRTLAIGAIESDEAREFLAAIPTVSELVPAARLAELEASIKGEES